MSKLLFSCLLISILISCVFGSSCSFVQFAVYDNDTACAQAIDRYVIYLVDSCVYEEDSGKYHTVTSDGTQVTFKTCLDSYCTICSADGSPTTFGACTSDGEDGQIANCFSGDYTTAEFTFSSSEYVSVYLNYDNNNCASNPYVAMYTPVDTACDNGGYTQCNNGELDFYQCDQLDCSGTCNKFSYSVCQMVPNSTLSYNYSCYGGSASHIAMLPVIAYLVLMFFLF